MSELNSTTSNKEIKIPPIVVGEAISKELQELIHGIMPVREIADVAANKKIGFSILRHLYYRQAPITEKNLEGIMAMILHCNTIIDKSITHFEKASSKFKELQKEVNSLKAKLEEERRKKAKQESKVK